MSKSNIQETWILTRLLNAVFQSSYLDKIFKSQDLRLHQYIPSIAAASKKSNGTKMN